jgi:hypothetical protein
LEAVDPANSQLQNIGDVDYQQRKLFTGGRRPRGLLSGFDTDINRAVLDTQEKVYQRVLHAINVNITPGLRQLFNLQLRLWGYDPADYPYVVQWVKKTMLSPEVQAEMLAKHSALGLAHPSTLSKEAGYDWQHEQAMFAKDEEANQAVQKQQTQDTDRIKAEVARIQALKQGEVGRGRPENSQAEFK